MYIDIHIDRYELLHGVIGGSADSISKLLRSFHGTYFEGESFGHTPTFICTNSTLTLCV